MVSEDRLLEIKKARDRYPPAWSLRLLIKDNNPIDKTINRPLLMLFKYNTYDVLNGFDPTPLYNNIPTTV